MIFKIGDILICKKDCVMTISGNAATQSKKSYKIIDVDEYCLYIIDDLEYLHSFDFAKNSNSYYGIWFYNKTLDRKEKLKQLKLI